MVRSRFWLLGVVAMVAVGCGDDGTVPVAGGGGAGGSAGIGGSAGVAGGAGMGGSGGVAPICGDSVINGDDECDDGNDVDGDDCTNACTVAVCGDGVVWSAGSGTEQCDDGNETSGDGCSDSCQLEDCGDGIVQAGEACDGGENCFPQGHVNQCQFVPAAFRVNSLMLADPHTYGDNCATDLTAFVNPEIDISTRTDFGSSQAPDDALDGLIDIGFALTLAPLTQTPDEATDGAFFVADCNVSDDPTPCRPTMGPDASSTVLRWTTKTSGSCLEPFPGTADFEVPTVSADGPAGCVVSDPAEITIAFGDVVSFPMSNVTLAAEWDSAEANTLTNGVVRGFISKADADVIVLDEDLLFIGGQTLSKTLSPRTGPNSRCNHQDTGPNDELGWWVYLTFSAERVPWNGDLMCGNGLVDLGVELTGGTVRDEMCDPGITDGANQCEPLMQCSDGLTCTEDTVNAGDPCAPTCFHRAIPDDGSDGCCPGTATDPNCVALCGNGVIDEINKEVCDDGAGSPVACTGADPAVLCDDGNPCTDDDFNENNSCRCVHVAIPDCVIE